MDKLQGLIYGAEQIINEPGMEEYADHIGTMVKVGWVRDVYAFLKEQPQWISIEDAEKPKTLQMVWVASRLYDGKIRVTLAKYRGRGYGKSHWLYPWNSVFWEEVIAWMPLKVPEPPMMD